MSELRWYARSPGRRWCTATALAVLVAATAACAGVTARQRVLIPAMEQVWSGVREDAEHGVGEVDAPDAARAAIVRAADALTQRDGSALLAAWPLVERAALAGVGRRLREHGIGPYGAKVLRERVVQFGRQVEALAAGAPAAAAHGGGR